MQTKPFAQQATQEKRAAAENIAVIPAMVNVGDHAAFLISQRFQMQIHGESCALFLFIAMGALFSIILIKMVLEKRARYE